MEQLTAKLGVKGSNLFGRTKTLFFRGFFLIFKYVKLRQLITAVENNLFL